MTTLGTECYQWRLGGDPALSSTGPPQERWAFRLTQERADTEGPVNYFSDLAKRKPRFREAK